MDFRFIYQTKKKHSFNWEFVSKSCHKRTKKIILNIINVQKKNKKRGLVGVVGVAAADQVHQGQSGNDHGQLDQ